MTLDYLATELEQCPEIAPVPGDQEYRLKLTRLTLGTQEEAKGGRQYLMATVDFPDVPTAEEMTIFVGFVPAAGDGSKEAIRSKNDIKDFCSAFNIPLSMLSEFDESQERPTLKSVEGLEARAMIGLRKSRRNEDRNENFVKQYLSGSSGR
jgi:hypothetical protein